MMGKHCKIAMFFALGLLIIIGAACDTSTEINETACSENSPPYIGKLFFEINGESTDLPLEFTISDKVGIYYEYLDYECNLDGGKVYYKIDSGEWEVGVILTDSTPCSSDEGLLEGERVGFEQRFTTLDPGEHVFKTGWVDGCDSAGNEVSVDFTIIDFEGDS